MYHEQEIDFSPVETEVSDVPSDERRTPEGSKSLQAYENLSEESKNDIRSLVQILDRNGISVAAYRELSLSPNGSKLPRLYLVEGCKESIGSTVEIVKTPGGSVGAEQDLFSALKADPHVSYQSITTLKVNCFNVLSCILQYNL